MEPMAAIGKVLKTHGVRGGLKVQPLSDFLQRVFKLKRVFIEKDNTRTSFNIREAMIHGRYWIIYLDGVETRDLAQTLAGALLAIPISERWELPEDVYYIDEVIGLDVFLLSGHYLGKVTDVLKPGGNDVYVIKDEKREILIPALKAVVRSIDLKERKIMVDPPEGIL